MGRFKLVRQLLTAAVTLAGASLAQSQQVGTYVGQTSDGHSVTLIVQFDAASNQFVLAQTSGTFTLNCRSGAMEWGLGLGIPYFIANGLVSADFVSPTFFMGFSMNFSGTQSVSGRIQGALPLFSGQVTPPRTAQSCPSKNLSFTATYTGTATTPVLPSGGLQSEATDELGRKARIYIRQLE